MCILSSIVHAIHMIIHLHSTECGDDDHVFIALWQPPNSAVSFTSLSSFIPSPQDVRSMPYIKRSYGNDATICRCTRAMAQRSYWGLWKWSCRTTVTRVCEDLVVWFIQSSTASTHYGKKLVNLSKRFFGAPHLRKCSSAWLRVLELFLLRAENLLHNVFAWKHIKDEFGSLDQGQDGVPVGQENELERRAHRGCFELKLATRNIVPQYIRDRYIFHYWRFAVISLPNGTVTQGTKHSVTPLGLSCWHVSLLYLYSAIYDSCELLMCTTGSLDAHTGHFRNLDT